MNNRVELNHRTWQGKSAEQLGYELAPAKIERYPVPRKNLHGNREYNVAFADGRKNDTDPIIVVMPRYDQRIDDHWSREIGITAAQRQALVATADPDITIDHRDPWNTASDRRPLVEMLQSFNGNFDSLARNVISGVDGVLNLEEGSRIEIQGPSQGASIGTALTGILLRGEYSKSFDVAYLDLIDPVNARSRHLVHSLKLLTELLTTEASRLKEILEENTFIGHGDVVPYAEDPKNAAVIRRLRHRQAMQTLLGGAGLRKGIDKPLIKLLTDPATREAAQSMSITFFHGENSTVSLKSDIDPTVDSINALGGNAQIVTLFDPEGGKVGHHFPNSFGKTAALGLAIANDRDADYGIYRLAA